MSQIQAEKAKIEHHKIFFFNPTQVLKTTVIDPLRDKEYEIYILTTIRTFKNILRHNPDSICIVNIDQKLQKSVWPAFLRSFLEDDALKTIKLGVYSDTLTNRELTGLFSTITLEAGIISRKDDTQISLFSLIKGLLDSNNAKGQRHSVRVSCLSDDSAYIIYRTDGKIHQMKIVDLSTTSAFVMVPASMARTLKKDGILKNVTIALDPNRITTVVRVYAVRATPSGSELAILEFLDDYIAPIERSYIRSYIFETLQRTLAYSIIGEPTDDTDYEELARNDAMMSEFYAVRNRTPSS